MNRAGQRQGTWWKLTEQDRGKELGGYEQSRTEARNLADMNRAGQRQGKL